MSIRTATALAEPDPSVEDRTGAVSVRLEGTGAMPIHRGSTAISSPTGLDAESRAWLRRLRAEGPVRERALEELRGLLVRAARFEVHRRRAALPHLRGGDHEDLAQQSADDALVALLAKLDDYRGDSRFTTWAYKFALLESAVKLRRRAWQGREIPLEGEDWSMVADRRPAPDEDVQTAELIAALRQAIARELTPHQREVLVAITLDDVPIDVLAERLSTTRGALYKTLHDARRKLRAHLSERGLHLADEGSSP